MVAGALVGAVQIDTPSVETDSWEDALIHIWRKDTEENEDKRSLFVAFF